MLIRLSAKLYGAARTGPFEEVLMTALTRPSVTKHWVGGSAWPSQMQL